MAAVYRLASSELAANVQLVSPAERRRSPNFADGSDDLVACRQPRGPAGTAREPAGEHRLDAVVRGPSGAVRADQARLPAVEVGLVDEAVVEHRAHGRVAREVRDHRRVDVRLKAVVGDPRDGLPAVVRVHRARGNRHLPADLVQPEAERRQRGPGDRTAGLREHGLRGAAEGVPDGLLDPAEVRGAPRSATGSRPGTNPCSSSGAGGRRARP